MGRLKKFFLSTLLILLSATAIITVSDGINILRGISAQPTSITVGDIIVSRPWADVRYFGASPSATVAVNTAAIQAAINSFASGGKVLLPPGIYNHTDLIMKDKVYLIGSGSRNTVLNYIGTNTAITIDANSAFMTGIKISDLQINANGYKAIVLKAGITMSLTECLFQNLFLTNVSHGIYINNTPLTTVYKNLFQNIKIYGVSAYGIFNDSGPYNTWNHIEITNVANGAYAIKNQGTNFMFSNISVDGVIDDAGGDGDWINTRIEGIFATTPPLTTAFRITNGDVVINDLIITDVLSAKCAYGLDISGTGNVVIKIRFTGTDYPVYPITLTPGSSGTIIEAQKGPGAFLLDQYTGTTVLNDWAIIGGNILGTQKFNVGLGKQGNIYPLDNNTYYLGKNSNSSPFAWKGVILKDTTNSHYYRIEVISGMVTATDLGI